MGEVMQWMLEKMVAVLVVGRGGFLCEWGGSLIINRPSCDGRFIFSSAQDITSGDEIASSVLRKTFLHHCEGCVAMRQ